MQAPTKLNGYAVVAAFPSPAYGSRVEGYMVVVRRPDVADFVTAFWAPHMGTCWHQGHYGFETLSAARADALARRD